MALTPPSSKDYIARPPKKRPFALFNYTLNSQTGLVDEENLQPEDLSMKSSRVHSSPRQSPPATPIQRPSTPMRLPLSTAPVSSVADTPSAFDFSKSSRTVMSSATLTPHATPRHDMSNATLRHDMSSLLGYSTTGLNLSTVSSNRNPTQETHRDTTTSSNPSGGFSFSSNMNQISSSTNKGPNFGTSFASANSSLMSSAGLRLISEVALACGRPTVLRAPGSNPGPHTPTQQVQSSATRSGPYAPPTPRDPLRTAMRERGVGVRSWPYHPYLPLGVYNLPSSLHSPSTPPPSWTKREMVHPSPRHRGGSVSPPGETGSSSSESSPEVQQQDSRSPRLSCPICNRRYATVAGLAKHHQFHCMKDANKSFACKHCDKVYTSLGALKMHIRTHTLPCKCPLCGKAFSRPWLLQGHIRTHTGEKPFQCPQCERCFADRSNLRAHLQTHTDVKKYACRTCPKTFSRMSLLVKHEDHGCPGMRNPHSLTVAPVPLLGKQEDNSMKNQQPMSVDSNPPPHVVSPPPVTSHQSPVVLGDNRFNVETNGSGTILSHVS